MDTRDDAKVDAANNEVVLSEMPDVLSLSPNLIGRRRS
jgi:hypothetical protein